MSMDFTAIINSIQSLFPKQEKIGLHTPQLNGNESLYVQEALLQGNIATAGRFLNDFETALSKELGVNHVVAVSSGTAALHLALKGVGVIENDFVITQSLTFVATANAISYCNAAPIFVDINKDTLGLSPKDLESFLEKNANIEGTICRHKSTGRVIRACLPMHTFGNPCRIVKIKEICTRWQLKLVEDSAQSIGSSYKSKALGTFGDAGVLSFNANKLITTGGGGCVLTNNKELADKIRYWSNQSKENHAWEFNHLDIGYNYRMSNIAAAIGLAQLEQLAEVLKKKEMLFQEYESLFEISDGVKLVGCIKEGISNRWLETLLFDDVNDCNLFIEQSNALGVGVRPVWKPLHLLPMYISCTRTKLEITESVANRLVSLPSMR